MSHSFLAAELAALLAHVRKRFHRHPNSAAFSFEGKRTFCLFAVQMYVLPVFDMIEAAFSCAWCPLVPHGDAVICRCTVCLYLT